MHATVDVADEVWIATALLHRENPSKEDFSNHEILRRAEQEGLVEPQRPGVATHVSSHAVAGKKPQPNDYRLLTETKRGRRRLFREGDTVHFDRHGKSAPSRQDIPSRYAGLLTWYEHWKQAGTKVTPSADPFLALAGTWTFGDADTYVSELRKGWD